MATAPASFRLDVFLAELRSSTQPQTRYPLHRYEMRGVRWYAERIGISHTTLHRLRTNDAAVPDLVTYARCCRFMGVPLDYYFS